MFLPALQLTSTEVNRYDYLQAAEASQMETLFTSYIAALVGANAQQGAPQLNVADIDIAGGGDGHTFVLRLLVSEATSGTTEWTVANLANVVGKFWMGSNAEALEAYQEAAIASLLTGQSPVTKVAVGLAGAAKGTRFMAFVAGVITPPG